ITGDKDASMSIEVLKVMHNIDVTDGLTAYVAAAQHTPYGGRQEPLDYDYYSENAKIYRSENLDPNFIKFFLDGVPTSSRSAAMTIAYAPDISHPHAGENKGMLHLSGEDFYKEIAEMDRRGFTIKIHAAGDRSVHEALEAYDYARKMNGNKDKMHEIAHAGYILDDDLKRFGVLNVSPDISPYLWFPSPIIDNIVSVLGERGLHYWPNKTLLGLGATIVAGSDWPSVSPTISPWPGIEATVTRANPYDKAEGILWSEERLTLAETLKIFTLNGAKALRIDDQAGSLEVGKNANIIILKDNLFDIPTEQIGETIILQTWYKGKKVYSGQ
ncbi:MAG: amidohydrolase family protein, partial [Emcibacter sp.]|nr:amidohydrolase family protein [Emcibacter sp.]